MANDSDNLDKAADLTRALAEAQISAVRQLAKPEQVQNADGTWPQEDCVDCGADLGKRLLLGKVRCVVCQERLEKRSRLWQR